LSGGETLENLKIESSFQLFSLQRRESEWKRKKAETGKKNFEECKLFFVKKDELVPVVVCHNHPFIDLIHSSFLTTSKTATKEEKSTQSFSLLQTIFYPRLKRKTLLWRKKST